MLLRFFRCAGLGWALRLYPGGDADRTAGKVCVYLAPDLDELRLSGRRADYEFGIVRPGSYKATILMTFHREWERGNAFPWWGNAILLREELLDKKYGWISEEGTVTFEVSMRVARDPVHVERAPVDIMGKQNKAREEVAASLAALFSSGMHRYEGGWGACIR